jgi:hypothetical protein
MFSKSEIKLFYEMKTILNSVLSIGTVTRVTIWLIIESISTTVSKLLTYKRGLPRAFLHFVCTQSVLLAVDLCLRQNQVPFYLKYRNSSEKLSQCLLPN